MALGNEMPASGNFIVAQQVVHRVITRHLLGQAGLKPDQADSGAITLIQRFGSAANIHLHCLVLDGVYRCGADGVPTFVRSRCAHRRRTAHVAAHGHHPADEDARAPGRAPGRNY
jgi:hypothetical protein